MIEKNNIKPTLLYINFPLKKFSNETINLPKIENNSYKILKSKLGILDSTFIDKWEKIEYVLHKNWENLNSNGSLYIKVNTEYCHYTKVLLDELLGRKNFLNEIIWVHSSGKNTSGKWPNTHDSILVYVKDKNNYIYNINEIDREPYMAPSLVTKEKAEKGKLPTDTWWYTYNETEEKIFSRIIKASTNEKDSVSIPFDENLRKTVLELNRNTTNSL